MSESNGRRSRPRVVFVTSIPFSGSTMLGLMLGAHRETVFLGETDLLARQRKDGTWRHRKYCSLCQDQDGERCPTWSRETVTEIRQDLDQVHSVMARIHPHAQILVDSSKDRDWWTSRLVYPGIRPVVVHISKSVEAYVASLLTRHPLKRPVEFVADDWAVGNAAIREFAISHSVPYLHLRYADVAADARGTLEKLGSLLGFEPEADQHEFWGREHHYIRGNPGTASHLDGKRAEREPGVNRELYRGKHRTIFVDDKWKRVLTPAQVDRIYALPSVRTEASSLGYQHPISGNGPSVALRVGESLMEPGMRLSRLIARPIRARIRDRSV